MISVRPGADGRAGSHCDFYVLEENLKKMSVLPLIYNNLINTVPVRNVQLL